MCCISVLECVLVVAADPPTAADAAADRYIMYYYLSTTEIPPPLFAPQVTQHLQVLQDARNFTEPIIVVDPPKNLTTEVRLQCLI